MKTAKKMNKLRTMLIYVLYFGTKVILFLEILTKIDNFATKFSEKK